MHSSDVIQLADGRRLLYCETGPRDGDPVVYCHGAIGTPLGRSLDLEALARELRIRYIAVNRPGVGGSDPAPGRTVLSFAADLRELAECPRARAIRRRRRLGRRPICARGRARATDARHACRGLQFAFAAVRATRHAGDAAPDPPGARPARLPSGSLPGRRRPRAAADPAPPGATQPGDRRARRAGGARPAAGASRTPRQRARASSPRAPAASAG